MLSRFNQRSKSVALKCRRNKKYPAVNNQKIARMAIMENDCFIRSHAPNEFCNVRIKKPNMEIDAMLVAINDLPSNCRFVAVGFESIEKSPYVHKSHQFSHYGRASCGIGVAMWLRLSIC
jgi:predicted nucleic acid-binding protein